MAVTRMAAYRRFKAVLAGCAAGVVAGVAMAPAHAQQFPTKSVRLIVPFAPGGPADVIARIVGPKLTETWGQQILVDNRGGANTILATEILVKAPPDGYTLLIISAGFAVNPSLYGKLPYDSNKDVAPVTLLSSGPAIVVVHPSLPARNIKELIAVAKSRPGQLVYASSGTGAPSHLSVELFKMMTGTDLTHVPYKGIAPGITDLIAGQVQVSFPTILGAMPHVKSGRLRALAVTSSKRSAAAPELPTVGESGVKGYEAANWFGLVTPAQTPAALVTQLHRDFARVLALPDVREKLSVQGMEAVSNTPADFGAYIRNEMDKWARVVKTSGARPE